VLFLFANSATVFFLPFVFLFFDYSLLFKREKDGEKPLAEVFATLRASCQDCPWYDLQCNATDLWEAGQCETAVQTIKQ